MTVVQVSGSHTYAEENTSYTAIVTIRRRRQPRQARVRSVPIPVGDAPLEPEGRRAYRQSPASRQAW